MCETRKYNESKKVIAKKIKVETTTQETICVNKNEEKNSTFTIRNVEKNTVLLGKNNSLTVEFKDEVTVHENKKTVIKKADTITVNEIETLTYTEKEGEKFYSSFEDYKKADSQSYKSYYKTENKNSITKLSRRLRMYLISDENVSFKEISHLWKDLFKTSFNSLINRIEKFIFHHKMIGHIIEACFGFLSMGQASDALYRYTPSNKIVGGIYTFIFVYSFVHGSLLLHRGTLGIFGIQTDISGKSTNQVNWRYIKIVAITVVVGVIINILLAPYVPPFNPVP